MRTSDKVAVVTGGSRGIGRSIALGVAACGYGVCISYQNNDDQADEVVRNIREQGGEAIAVKGDVSRQEDVERLFAEADKLGRVAALINNAGITGEHSRVADLPPDLIRRVFEVNVFGVFHCAKAAIRRMSTAYGGQGGVIVNLSSGAAKSGSPGSHVHYASSKAAIDTLTVGLAREVGLENIRVNAIRAGVVDTEIHASKTKERLDSLTASIPLGRLGEPEEISDTVLWLLSDQATYVTGALIDVSGGL